MAESDASSAEEAVGSSWKRATATRVIGEDATAALATRTAALRTLRSDTLARAANRLTRTGRSDWNRLRLFENVHAGKRAIIIGNGPSLKNTNLDLIQNEITFGLNRIYLLFESIGWSTSYHVVINQLVVQQCVDDLLKINVPLFTTTMNRQYLESMPNAVFLRSIAGPRFSNDPTIGVWEGATVTYVALQLAYFMGFSEVVLIGVDHRFAETGPPHQVVESSGPDTNHFDPKYFGKGFKWQLPDLALSEQAYRLAKHRFESDGRRVIDSTVDGALNVFPKVTLEQILKRPM